MTPYFPLFRDGCHPRFAPTERDSVVARCRRSWGSAKAPTGRGILGEIRCDEDRRTDQAVCRLFDSIVCGGCRGDAVRRDCSVAIPNSFSLPEPPSWESSKTASDDAERNVSFATRPVFETHDRLPKNRDRGAVVVRSGCGFSWLRRSTRFPRPPLKRQSRSTLAISYPSFIPV